MFPQYDAQPPYLQLANAIRKGILTRKRYKPGLSFKEMNELIKRFKLPRDSVERAFDVLIQEGLVEFDQDTGRYKVTTAWRKLESGLPKDDMLQTCFVNAFEKCDVSLDVYTLTSEKLNKLLQKAYELMKSGERPYPDSISVRLLLPDTEEDLVSPRAVNDPTDKRPLERLSLITRVSLTNLHNQLMLMQPNGRVKVRVGLTPYTPQFKLIFLNERDLLHGLYSERISKASCNDEEVEIYDVLNRGEYIHYSLDSADPDAVKFVERHRVFFDSNWLSQRTRKVSLKEIQKNNLTAK